MQPDHGWFTQLQEALRDMESGHVPGSMTSTTEREAMLDGDEAAFHRWVDETLAEEHTVPDDWVTHTSYWITDGEQILGFIDLRHELTDKLLRFGGHIGYAVGRSARGKGVAGQALTRALQECDRRGITEVLITCDQTNRASQAVIERAGGELENIEGTTRRYWIRRTSAG